MSTRRFTLIALSAAALSTPLRAQPAYPARPVRIVVPFAPGGGVDTIARVLAQKLGEALGQAFIVENRPGASTAIGSAAVARAAPDGYTLLMASSSFTTAPSLVKALPFDPEKDFTPVVMVANSPAVLATTLASPANSLAQLIALAKARPGKLTSANYGSGSTPHLVSELFQQMTGTQFLNVPYNGGSPAVVSTLTGQTDVIFPTALPVLSLKQAGKIKLLAIAARRRSALLPDVPTFAEQGVALETGTWFGLLAPAGTPAAVVGRVRDAVVKLAADPALRKKIQDEGAEVDAGTTEEFAAFLKADQQRWSRVIASAHIVAE